MIMGLWDANTGTRLQRVSYLEETVTDEGIITTGSIQFYDWSPDNSQMAIAIELEILFVSTTDFTINTTSDRIFSISDVDWSPDGSIVAVGGGFDQNIYFVDPLSGEIFATMYFNPLWHGVTVVNWHMEQQQVSRLSARCGARGLICDTSHIMITLLLLSIGIVGTSQDETTIYVIQLTDEGLAFNIMEADGAIQPTGIAFENFTIRTQGIAEWEIFYHDNIVLSPTQDHIAWVAYNDTPEVALFLYTFETDELIQVPLDGNMIPLWSPSGRYLLLRGFVGGEIGVGVPESHVYDVGTNELTQVTASGALELGFHWIDDERLFWSGGGQACESPCRAWHDIYTGDRFGTNGQVITNLGSQTPLEIANSICNSVWSQLDQRIYFVIGECIDSFNDQYLYSVDLNGNLRFERNLSDIYPDAFYPPIISAMYSHPTTGRLTVSY